MVTILSALISQTHEEESCQGACCVSPVNSTTLTRGIGRKIKKRPNLVMWHSSLLLVMTTLCRCVARRLDGSLTPRLSAPGFVSRFWRRINRKAWENFTYQMVPPWHHIYHVTTPPFELLSAGELGSKEDTRPRWFTIQEASSDDTVALFHVQNHQGFPILCLMKYGRSMWWQ